MERLDDVTPSVRAPGPFSVAEASSDTKLRDTLQLLVFELQVMCQDAHGFEV